jgi:hypothetical protein
MKKEKSMIAGFIVDKSRRPLGNVKIALKGKIVAESGPDGFFSVSLTDAESRTALTFTAEGHVPNTKIFNARTSGGPTVVVVWPFAYRVRFDPARDLDLELGGTRIQIPANALTAGGAGISGTAALTYTLFDVTSALERAAAPGDFSGRMLDGSIRRLNSYGIFSGGLRDLKDRPLSLRRGAKIDLAVPVSPRLIKNAPKQIGYFDFDEPGGLWIQVGSFDLTPETLTYNGSVTSFGGAHNLDDPQDTVCVTLHVQDSWGYPAAYANVTAHGPQYSSQGTANANGDVCLLVQRNAGFWADAWGQSGGSYFTSAPFGQQNFTSPNFSSGAGSCGDPNLCPFVGNLLIDYVVGTHRFALSGEKLPGLY